MLDFIYKLNDALITWPQGMKLTLHQVSEVTKTSVPHVIQYLADGLNKDMDIAGLISNDEASVALTNLSKKMQSQIELRERELAQQREVAETQYLKLMDRVRLMQVAKQWHQAYRSLNYFAGEYEGSLSRDTLMTLANDILWSGTKANANIQELGQWLQRAVFYSISAHTKAGIEDALDLIDAYGEHFLSENSAKGPLILGNILAVLEEPAAKFELWEQYKGLVDILYPA